MPEGHSGRRAGRRALILAIFVAAIAAGSVAVSMTPALDAGSKPTPTPRAVPLSGLHIALAARVTPVLLRGAQPDAAGLRELHDLGVRTVLDLRAEHVCERADVEAAGMTSVAVPLQSGRQAAAPNRAQLRAFFAIVLDPARQPVFVHCSHGKDRTGVLVAAYRMEIEGWTAEQALEEMRSLGFKDDHPNLTAFVRGYRRQGFAVAR